MDVDKLYFVPCVPPTWTSYNVRYRFRRTFYDITINFSEVRENTDARFVVDGVEQEEQFLLMVDDEREHKVDVIYS